MAHKKGVGSTKNGRVYNPYISFYYRVFKNFVK